MPHRREGIGRAARRLDPPAHLGQTFGEFGNEVVADQGREGRHLGQREIAGRTIRPQPGQDGVAGAHASVSFFMRFCRYQAWKLWRGAWGISRFFPQVLAGL